MTDAAAPCQTDLKDRLEELRASVAGRAEDGRLAEMLRKVMLRLLTLLLGLLADLRAGRLVAPTPAGGARDACGPLLASPLSRPVAGREGVADGAAVSGSDGGAWANASPAAVSRPAALRGETGQRECRADGAAALPLRRPFPVKREGVAVHDGAVSGTADPGEGDPALYRAGMPGVGPSSAYGSGG